MIIIGFVYGVDYISCLVYFNIADHRNVSSFLWYSRFLGIAERFVIGTTLGILSSGIHVGNLESLHLSIYADLVS